MANYIDPYDPIFYAQEGLIVLENALGMAGRVYRGYDRERKSVNRGETIQIRKPSSFTTQAGGTGTAADLNTQSISMTVDNWREVKFGVTDAELAKTGPEIITDHISPAVYALAEYIETQLTNEYKNVPWSYNVGSTPAASDIIGARKILRDNAGALIGNKEIVHFAIDTQLEADFLGLEIFHAADKTGDNLNTDALMNGSLGIRFGVEHFVQQTLADHTSGTVVSNSTDVAGALNGDHAIRATTVSINGLTGTETIKAGDSFVIAGNTQRYSVTSDVTLSGGASASVPIYPALQQAYSDTSVVTFETIGASNYADRYYSNIMFHRNAFAIALAPLPEVGDEAGAKMAVITDPRTKLSMRSRIAYDDTNAKVLVTLDVLFGVKTIEPNLAVIARRDY